MTSHEAPEPAARGAARRWHLRFWPVALAAALGAWLALDHAASALYTENVNWLGQRYDTVDAALGHSLGAGRRSRRMAVVYFGDSTVAEYEEGPALPQLTALQLDRMYGRPAIEMVNASAPGAGILQYAFLADRIAAYEPDLVIWQLSFFQFTDRWTAKNGAPELVGFVDAARLPEILAMPIEAFRLSLSDLLLQQAIVRLGLHDLHLRVRTSQLRFAHLIDLAEDALNPNRGRKPEARAQAMRGRKYMKRHQLKGSELARYSAYGERVHFETTLDGLDPAHPKLALLGSGIRALRARGVDVLVYLNPANVEHLRKVGVLDEAGLHRTVDAIEATVSSSGAHFLDLHELLADEHFRDRAGHFVEDEIQTIPRRVTKEVAKAAREILIERKKASRAERREGGR